VPPRSRFTGVLAGKALATDSISPTTTTDGGDDTAAHNIGEHKFNFELPRVCTSFFCISW
jgi:hypothetical protein